jgi:Uma2 family endonuclease
MNTARPVEFLSVQDYLDGELHSEIRHEYIGGIVYAMAGTSDAHNLISGNLFAAIHSHLRGGPCRVFMSELKVRLLIADQDIFYYPDVMVTCDPRDTERYFKQFPKVLVEVLSESTERIDRREKFLSYTGIERLEEYVLAAQDKMEVTIFRRANQWKPEIFRAPEETARLASLDFSVPLRLIYEGVDLMSAK